MHKKVIANTSGMVMPTTKPGRMSTYHPQRPPLCKPSETKLTNNTITTASISTRTNSPTEEATALGWSCTDCRFTPTGKVGVMVTMASFKALPKAMMSPPLAMDTPKAMTD